MYWMLAYKKGNVFSILRRGNPIKNISMIKRTLSEPLKTRLLTRDETKRASSKDTIFSIIWKQNSFLHRILHVFDFLSSLFLLFTPLVGSLVWDILRSGVISLSPSSEDELFLLFASLLPSLEVVFFDSFIAKG